MGKIPFNEISPIDRTLAPKKQQNQSHSNLSLKNEPLHAVGELELWALSEIIVCIQEP